MENLLCHAFVFIFVTIFAAVFLLVLVYLPLYLYLERRKTAPQVESRPAVEDLLCHRPPGPCCCSSGRAAQ